jgi:hypothetical protein
VLGEKGLRLFGAWLASLYGAEGHPLTRGLLLARKTRRF